MFSKKGQGLSLNAVIIAVLVLVVLLIMVGITTGYFKRWTDKFKVIAPSACIESGVAVEGSACRAKGAVAHCKADESEKGGLGEFGCAKDEKCCVKTG